MSPSDPGSNPVAATTAFSDIWGQSKNLIHITTNFYSDRKYQND